jgi:pimeloyl-ACP methyl ester carboxylesterase
MHLFFSAMMLMILTAFGVFVFPIPKPSYRVIYARVQAATAAALQAFRRRHTFKQVVSGRAVWRYYDVGSGPETILFLHGMGGSGDIWFQQIDALSASYRCIAPTYPAVADLEQLRGGILGVLAQEGLQTVHVVGSSMGGYLAQYLMSRDPARIRKAVLGNTFPPNEIIPRRAGQGARYLPWIPEWTLMLGLRHNAEQVLFRTSGQSELVRAYLIEQTCGFMRKSDFIARCACLTQGFTPPLPDVVLSGSLLIVESDNDPLVEAELRAMLRSTYPTAGVKTFQGSGHFPYLSRADEYTQVLAEFLSDSLPEGDNQKS